MHSNNYLFLGLDCSTQSFKITVIDIICFVLIINYFNITIFILMS